jgi:hypothetical protein
MAFLAFPAWVNFGGKRAKSGSYRRTISAIRRRMDRTLARPPRTRRLPGQTAQQRRVAALDVDHRALQPTELAAVESASSCILFF